MAEEENKQEEPQKEDAQAPIENQEMQSSQGQSDEDLMKLWEEAMEAQKEVQTSDEAHQQNQSSNQEQDISKDLQRILDIPLSITVVIGTTVITIKELLNLRPGSVVALDESINSFVSVYANGKLIAKAELVVVGENFGIRISEIIEKEERVKTLANL
ncbi:flagellar motor switch protein FliN [Hydrogenobaculum acidophilum]